MSAKLEREAALRIEYGPDGQLRAEVDGEPRPVRVRRCFPWSEPTRFISLLDEEENEVALVPDIQRLDPSSREALEAALAEAGFVLQIERIEAIEEEVEIRTWSARTKQGPRSFQTRRDEWPREVPGGGYLIRDVAGDLYHIPEPHALDAKSLDLLWAFVD